MRKLVFFSVAMAGILLVNAQKVVYTVSFPNIVHHEAHIELTVSGISLEPAIFKMSRSSPGRYATHEFGKNVYDVMAFDSKGNKIVLNRTDGDIYEVPRHTGTITLSYTLYGNYADGTYAGIDAESIHLNMPACFMWMKGMEKAPIEISFIIPKGNKGVIATQLITTKEVATFTAPDLQYFMDSPTKIGDLKFREWTISNNGGKSFVMRIALESNATDAQADELSEKVKKIVQEAKAVFGEFPNYDNGSYTFIASANPYVYGDGMEHRNSTMICLPIFTFNANFLLGVFSHEYFHNWNVERIRPKTLEPFNFEKSNMSNELWFAEGFTQYFGELILARSGYTLDKNYLSTVTGLVNAKQTTPGARDYSPVQASNHSVFVDASVSIDKNNYTNMFTSYYTYGASIALALDLEMQSRFHKNIDTYMQAMWKRFGKTEIPYTIPTMQQTLATVTDAPFAEEFFSKYIIGHEPINYSSLLGKVGYNLININEGKSAIGINIRINEQGKFVVTSNTTKGTAAYEAGLDINDELIKLDETPVKNTSDLSSYIQNKRPGDAILVTYKHRNIEKQTTIVLKEQVAYSLVLFENSGKTITEEMQKIRSSWFTSQIK